MKDIEVVLEKLKCHYGTDNIGEILVKLDIPRGTYDTWVNRSDIPMRRLRDISDKVGISPSVLLDRDKDHPLKDIFDKIDKSTVSYDLVASNAQYLSRSSFVYAPVISAKASAGTGSVHYDVEVVGQLMIDRMMFKIIPNLKDIRAIEVMGDSMYPTLKENDYVIIEENEQFSGEGIYVLQFDSMLLVKRLQATSRGIKVISDNRNYQYLFKNSLEKSHECFDMGLITGALTTDGQLYGDLKEAELYTYVIGGFGKQMRFGATMNATADNKTDLMIYYYGMNSENMMSIIKRTYTGECKSCRCVEEDKAK